ncbi:hypothetical protein CANCADRAFT_31352 [Tortispora caseinolytica NRRL Y-17796]|uniref:Serine/threonine-protein kinase BSK1-like TPR repeats domain-containing protein n=1 Tax=Tortispora caseinolytica NRRL Y-17796 TaxID=767744 RepID=A0A1E4TF10_9ASCO|nr:hypothetical protein CANCADRAFT_31352 [Tortispora caseinolytica NRRL Y-17796]
MSSASFISEHKVVFTAVGLAALAGTGYYLYTSSRDATPKAPNSEKKSEKKKQKKSASSLSKSGIPPLEEIDPAAVPETEKADLALKVKDEGNAYFKKKDYTKAIEYYTKAIDLDPKNATYFSNRAACYMALKQYDEAIDDSTKAIAIDRYYVKALSRRANAYENVGRLADAINDYTVYAICQDFKDNYANESIDRVLKAYAEQEAVKISKEREPRLPSRSFVRGFMFSFHWPTIKFDDADTPDTANGQLKEAMKVVREPCTDEFYNKAAELVNTAIENGTTHLAFAKEFRGTMRFLSNDTEGALQDFNDALKMQESSSLYVKRANVVLEMGNPVAANADFEKAMAIDPKNPDIYFHQAQVHFLTNDFAPALEGYQKTIDLDPDFIMARIQLAVTNYKLGNVGDALREFQTTIKEYPDASEARLYFGEVLLDLQKFDKALEQFDGAMAIEERLYPTCMNCMPLLNKALTLFQINGVAASGPAKELCNKALAIDPLNDTALATLAQIALQEGKPEEAEKYFEKQLALVRSIPELTQVLMFLEATKSQTKLRENYPELAARIAAMNAQAALAAQAAPQAAPHA